MPRGKEPSWSVQELIFELLARLGDEPAVIQRSLDVWMGQSGITEDTPGIRSVRRTIAKLQDLDLDVLSTLPPEVWKKRHDYDQIREDLERRAGMATGSGIPLEPGPVSESEGDHLLSAKPEGKRVSPRLRQLHGFFDLAGRLQTALSRLSAKDRAAWELPGAPWLPYYSGASSEERPAELRTQRDGEELSVSLAVEKDKRFRFLLLQLEAIFPEFSGFWEWRQGLTEFIGGCQELTREIWRKAEGETCLRVSMFDPGNGFLLNAPMFIYDFALDNYLTGELPRLELLPYEAYRLKLTPEGHAGYTLAVGSEAEITTCEQSAYRLCRLYTQDGRTGDIKSQEARIQSESQLFQRILDEVLSPFRNA